MMENVILVDDNDNEVGSMEKMEAHRQGKLHRAFSVLLFNQKGELLIQKRALTKYHSPGLWTNTCCSHPRPHEPTDEAVRRRLKEEMGIDMMPRFTFKFQYHAVVNNDLIEHEMDHVYVGKFCGQPLPNMEEVDSWRFIGWQELQAELIERPDHFTCWFKLLVTHKEFESILDNVEELKALNES